MDSNTDTVEVYIDAGKVDINTDAVEVVIDAVKVDTDTSTVSLCTYQAVTPYLVSTKMSMMAEPTGIVIPTPRAYVQHALRAVGVRIITPGYFWHDMQVRHTRHQKNGVL